MQTKAVSLTEDELNELIHYHGRNLTDDTKFKDHCVERLNYLHKRLKAFKEPELTEQIKNTNTAAGWGTENNG